MPNRPPTERQVLWAIRIAVVLGVLIAIGHSSGITLWDWAKLLIVPAVITGGGVWFANQRASIDREIAVQRSQDDMLQAYFDRIEGLLLDEDRSLPGPRKSEDSDEARRLEREKH